MPSEWTIQTYGSGTHIVIRAGGRAPHFYVYAAPGLSRIETCEELRDWMNGEIERPGWTTAMIRATEETAHHPAVNEHGAILSIQATGPSVESTPGRGDWTNDPAYADERAALMDTLCGHAKEADDE